MFSAILDVVLGIVLLYLILSIMASAASEFITNIFNRRAHNLEYFLKSLLRDSNITTKEFYNYTLIAPQIKEGVNPQYISSKDFAQALFDLVRAKYTDIPAGTPLTMDDWRSTIALLPDNSPLKNVMTGIMSKSTELEAKVEDELNQMRQNLEQWYDSSMERVSGWFKRNTQFILLAIGLGVALVFNIDTIAVTNNLLQNPALREAIAAQAGGTTERVTQGSGQNSNGTTTNSTSTTDNRLTFNELKQELDMLNLPIGWPDRNIPNPGLPFPYYFTQQWNWWLKKLAGIVITGLAVSQGAPFWFDLLNKIMVIRSTVKPHEKSPEEASEDRQPTLTIKTTS